MIIEQGLQRVLLTAMDESHQNLKHSQVETKLSDDVSTLNECFLPFHKLHTLEWTGRWLSPKFHDPECWVCRLLYSPWTLSVPGEHCKLEACSYRHVNTKDYYEKGGDIWKDGISRT